MCNINEAVARIEQSFSSVSKFPLSGPDNMPTPHYGLFRDDDSHCFPVAVKSGYVPHTTQHITDLTRACVEAWNSNHECKVTPSWGKYGHRVIIGPSKDYRKSIVGTKDNIFPRVVLDFPFSRRPKFVTGMFRDACTNLQMLTGDKFTISFGHQQSGMNKLDEYITLLKSSPKQFDNVYDLVTKMEAQKVDVAKFVSDMYPAPEPDASPKAQTQHTNKIESIINRMMTERTKIRDTPSPTMTEGTLWEVVNAITGYVQHDKSRRTNNGTPISQIERAFASIEDNECKTAWDNAMALVC